jgi:hypothetical protein
MNPAILGQLHGLGLRSGAHVRSKYAYAPVLVRKPHI